MNLLWQHNFLFVGCHSNRMNASINACTSNGLLAFYEIWIAFYFFIESTRNAQNHRLFKMNSFWLLNEKKWTFFLIELSMYENKQKGIHSFLQICIFHTVHETHTHILTYTLAHVFCFRAYFHLIVHYSRSWCCILIMIFNIHNSYKQVRDAQVHI